MYQTCARLCSAPAAQGESRERKPAASGRERRPIDLTEAFRGRATSTAPRTQRVIRMFPPTEQ
jgi:hypothetical protein